jgi:hypothetical protein
MGVLVQQQEYRRAAVDRDSDKAMSVEREEEQRSAIG